MALVQAVLRVRAVLATAPAGCRALHHSSVLRGKKSLLQKFASKSRKKFWYAGPTIGSQLIYKPPSLPGFLKTTQPKTRREDGIRMRTLNVILYKAVTELLDSCEVSQVVYDLQVQISKVALAGDFSACRVYWKTTGDAETDDHTEKILQRSASRIRHLMMNYKVIGGVPPVVFVKDRESAAILEVERLLKVADFGPEATDDLMQSQSDLSSDLAASIDLPSPNLSNVFGIDHEELNKQIAEYKKRSQQKEQEPVGVGLAEQLAELRKQKILKRKMKERKSFFHDDVTPQTYLLDKYSEDVLDSISSLENGLENEMQDELEELETEDLDIPTKTEENQVTKS